MSIAPELSIEARWILPMTEPDLVLEHHALLIANGRILDILPRDEAARRYPDAARVARPTHLLMPGLVNAHTHAAMSLFRGLAEGLPLQRWLSEKIWPLERRMVDARFVRDGSLLSMAEMLRAGITCFADMYIFPDETARTVAEQGMRARIGLPVADFPSPWAQAPAEYLSKALEVRDAFKGHPRIDCAFAPHAPYSVSDATFERIRTLADELDAPIAIHLHESAQEITDSLQRHGVRPIERLQRLGLLGPTLNAIHMAHVSPADIELAMLSRISVTLCAESNLKLGNGAPPVRDWTRSELAVALGSDGPASNNDQDLWLEIRLAALLARASGEEAPPLSPWSALALATRGGAAALGLAEHVGTLEAGKWADLCCVDFDRPAMQPVYDPIAQLVFSGGRDCVSDVWVAGRPLLEAGELTRLDWPAVRARAQEWARRLSQG